MSVAGTPCAVSNKQRDVLERERKHICSCSAVSQITRRDTNVYPLLIVFHVSADAFTICHVDVISEKVSREREATQKHY